jgi:hypothetical protein
MDYRPGYSGRRRTQNVSFLRNIQELCGRITLVRHERKIRGHLSDVAPEMMEIVRDAWNKILSGETSSNLLYKVLVEKGLPLQCWKKIWPSLVSIALKLRGAEM